MRFMVIKVSDIWFSAYNNTTGLYTTMCGYIRVHIARAMSMDINGYIINLSQDVGIV